MIFIIKLRLKVPAVKGRFFDGHGLRFRFP